MKTKAQLGRFISFILLLRLTKSPASSNSAPIHTQRAMAASLPLTAFLRDALQRAKVSDFERSRNDFHGQLVFRISTPE